MKTFNLKRRIISVLVTMALVLSSVGIQSFASENDELINGLTKFVFNGDSVTVTEGTDTNYEVVIYDSTDTETDAVMLTAEDGSTTYSVPEGSNGELLVSIKKKGGSYVFEGTGNGSIAVKKEATKDAILYLNGLDLTSSFTAAVTVKKDSEASCTIYVLGGTENTLTDNSYNNDDVYADNAAAEKAVMKFKDGSNVIFDGSGTLNINANGKNGIKGNNQVTFNGSVTYNIEALDNGVSCDKNLVINGGTFNIETSEGDGIKAGADDEPIGDIEINGGTFNIDSYADGIQATANLTINGGTFDITCYGGYTVKYNGDDSSYPSAKALKASGSYEVTASDGTITEVDNTECYLVITGGTFNLNCPDDAVHSDKNLTVSGGNFTINTADDAFHSEYVTTMGSETSTEESLIINILHSYEGIEGAEVNLYDGYYRIYSSDDCVNAANGDLSRYTFVINVYGGNIYASTTTGDCFDSNKDLNIYDGQVVVLGALKSNEGNAPLDCDGKLNITGGTVLEIGLSQMAVTPASGQAYVAWTGTGVNTAVKAGSSSGGSGFWPGSSTRPGSTRPGSGSSSSGSGSITNGDTVTILGPDGEEMFSIVAFWDTTVSASVNYVLFSSPDVVAGSSYTLEVSDGVTPTMIPTVTATPGESDDPNNTDEPGNTDEPLVTPDPLATPDPDSPIEPPINPDEPPIDNPGDEPIPGGDDAGFYYGDTDMNKSVDAVDALAMLKHAAKIQLITDGLSLSLSDVNHDGNINAEDALEALKIAAKIREAELFEFVME